MTSLLRLTRFGNRMLGSLAFWPALSATLAIAAGMLLPLVDRQLAADRKAWFLFDGGAESAREVLSTITSSMITLTALVFSITVLVLQLASNQFSPRIIRSFLREKSTRQALSIFVGTFVFSMVVLTKVRVEPDEFVPGLSVWVAFVLVLLSTGVFIHYIDRMTQSVRAITIISRIAGEARRSLELMYPEPTSGRLEPEHELPASAPDHVVYHEGPPGVLAAVDCDALLEVAGAKDGCIVLVHKIGDFVPSGGPIFRLWGHESPDEDRLRGALSIEEERTIEQDPAFGFRQLVDIAVRALSPGVNDPTTAVQALDHLHDLLRRLTRCEFPPEAQRNEHGNVCLLLPRPNYRDYVRLALEEIAQYGESSVQVNRRMRALLRDCLAVAPSGHLEILLEERARMKLD